MPAAFFWIRSSSSVNGSTFDATSGVAYDSATGSMTITFSNLKPVPPLILDGEKVTVSIFDLADLAGNHIPQPFTWSWQANFRQTRQRRKLYAGHRERRQGSGLVA